MNKAFKIFGIIAAGIAFLALGGFGYVQLTYDRDFSDVPMPDIRASDDPAVIAQGEYLVHAVAHCSACHGPADSAAQHKLGDPRDLSGGFEMQAGPFGTFYPSNLSAHPETGIGNVSDGELARAIRNGVDRHGGLAAFMRIAVGPMADEDLEAVISYLRTLPPVDNEVPADRWGFIAKALAGRFEPRTEPPPLYVPPGEISVDRGAYLAWGPALCVGCHTETDPMAGFALAGEPFSGARTPEPDPSRPGYEFVAPNLTPDAATGVMAGWTEDEFVARFRQGRVYAGSPMPWDNFRQMTDEDLRSIYRFLDTLDPVENAAGPSHREAGWKP